LSFSFAERASAASPLWRSVASKSRGYPAMWSATCSIRFLSFTGVSEVAEV
jgi:hypothetical protein